MISKFIILLLFFSCIKIAHQLQNKCIFTIIKEFKLNNPHLIGLVENKLDLFKFLSKNSQFLNINPRIEQLSANGKITKNSIVLLKSQTKMNYHFDFPKNPYWSCLLISKDTKFEELLNIVASQTDISQKVFILKQDSLEIYEAYKINQIIVKKKLGHFDLFSNNFKWQKDVNTDFIKRRSDFHGIVLKGIVGFFGLDMLSTDSEYQEKAPYFKNNDTYQINGFTSGLIHDVMLNLQERLNFTTVLYKRKIDIWGSGLINSKNETYKENGMLGDIFFKRVDIGVVPFIMTIERANSVDFLYPIKDSIDGIFIPILTERYDYESYFAPFSLSLWLTLGITGVSFAAWRFILLKFHASETIFGFDQIWTSFSGFLGGKPTPTPPIDKKTSYKTMIIVTLLCSTIVWIAYRARLSSMLAIQKKKYPFHNMEGFSKTNWR